MNEFVYEEETAAQQALARFGRLRTPHAAAVELPAMSPALRTHHDAQALKENVALRMPLNVVTPYLTARGFLNGLSEMLGAPGHDSTLVALETRPFVIPDPESEALSLNCIARRNLSAISEREGIAIPDSVRSLMMSGLSGDSQKGRRVAYTAWKDAQRKYGFSHLADFLRTLYDVVQSDVFLAPSCIIRAEPSRLARALGWAYDVLEEEFTEPMFRMHGIHLLLHSEVFSDDPDSRELRLRLYSELDKWAGRERREGMVFSFKVYDANGYLTGVDSGSTFRRNLSEFVTEVSERVRRAMGLVMAHNLGLWGIGMIDSGADLAAFRMSGKALRIDTPIWRGPRKGHRKLPPMVSVSTLVEEPHGDWQRQYQSNRTFVTPPHVPAKPYWQGKYAEQVVYASRVRTDTYLELVKEYREAAMEPEIPLAEALRSRVMDSEARQELVDLCPSLG